MPARMTERGRVPSWRTATTSKIGRGIAIGIATLGFTAGAAGVAGAAGAAGGHSPSSHHSKKPSARHAKQPGDQATTRNKGYATTVCNAPSSGVALRQTPSNTGTVIRQLHNGDGFHVYRTHNTVPTIPEGWALGYVIGGGNGDDGYTKLAYLC